MSNPITSVTRPPLIFSIPHSGERVPDQTPWLKTLPETILMCDVDRFVDTLYTPALMEFEIPFIKTEWHRYAVDLNRIPEDIDQSSVVDAKEKPGYNSRGYHWVMTTRLQNLMPQPMSRSVHNELTQLIYEPFHLGVKSLYASEHERGYKQVYHIDAHSMPSVGTSEHRDPGERRADIVISDCKGQSCSAEFRDLVIAAYAVAGFRVAYNWPYFGGRLTEQYGAPQRGQHAIQVELNRALYMDEDTKRIRPELLADLQLKLKKSVGYIWEKVADLRQ